jgi:putative hemolysin
MEIWLIFIALLATGYFSGTETAFLTVSRLRLAGFLHRKIWGAKSAHWFVEKPVRFVTTTLFGTTICTIAASSLITAYLHQYDISNWWILTISTILVLVFGDIIPKSLGRDLAESAVLFVSPSLRIFQVIFYPLIQIIHGSTTGMAALFGQKPDTVDQFFTRRDFELLIRESLTTGALQPHSESLISRALRFGSTITRDVMTPRIEIVGLERNDSPEDLQKIALSNGLSKIPIYEGDIDHIIGVVHALDLFDHPKTLTEIIRPIPFFPDQKKAWQAYRDLRNVEQSMAVVVDEWGGTAGIVTLKDFVEEVTGDVDDEHDPHRLEIREVGAKKWVVSARMEVEEINRQLHLEIPEGIYETLGGYLSEQLGRIPQRGDEALLDGLKFEILRSTRTRIRVVVIEKIEEGEDD